jgi:hypothetical protein
MITADTWAIVAATGLGPVLAVGLTLAFTYWRETEAVKTKNEAKIYDRRLNVFRTLMSTRRAVISPEHVSAINLVEVDFYKCKEVEAAWKSYKEQLDKNEKPEDDLWRRERDKRLSKLLYEIAIVLGFDIPAIEIFEGGYAPGGWAFRDGRYIGMLEFINDLSEGKKHIPVGLQEGTQQKPEIEIANV